MGVKRRGDLPEEARVRGAGRAGHRPCRNVRRCAGKPGARVTGEGCSDEPRDPFEEELRSAIDRVDPVPDDVVADARRARQGAAPAESKLLDLLYDSALDEQLTSLKADDGIRLLTFEGGGLRVEIRLDRRDNDSAALSCWTVPIRVVTAWVRTARATCGLELERNGSFVAVAATEPVRVELECEVLGKVHKWHTEWFHV